MLSKSFLCIAVILSLSATSIVAESNRIARNDGILSDREQVPFQALIFRTIEGATTKYKCGGAIVSKHHILTAAVCVESVERSQLYVNVDSNKELLVKKITLHFLYSDKKNNIALLELTEPLVLSPLVQPIPFLSTDTLDDQEVIALGVNRSESVSSDIFYFASR